MEKTRIILEKVYGRQTQLHNIDPNQLVCLKVKTEKKQNAEEAQKGQKNIKYMYHCSKCPDMKSNRMFNAVRHYRRFHMATKNVLSCACGAKNNTKGEHKQHVSKCNTLLCKRSSYAQNEEKENLPLEVLARTTGRMQDLHQTVQNEDKTNNLNMLIQGAEFVEQKSLDDIFGPKKKKMANGGASMAPSMFDEYGTNASDQQNLVLPILRKPPQGKHKKKNVNQSVKLYT